MAKFVPSLPLPQYSAKVTGKGREPGLPTPLRIIWWKRRYPIRMLKLGAEGMGTGGGSEGDGALSRLSGTLRLLSLGCVAALFHVNLNTKA